MVASAGGVGDVLLVLVSGHLVDGTCQRLQRVLRSPIITFGECVDRVSFCPFQESPSDRRLITRLKRGNSVNILGRLQAIIKRFPAVLLSSANELAAR